MAGYQLGRRSHAPSSLRRRTVVASGSGGTNPVGPTSGIAGAGGAPASATTSTAAAVMSPASLIAWELDDSALGQSSGARFWPVTCEGLKLGAMPLWAVSTGAFAFDNGAVAAALRGEAVREDVPGIPEAFMIHNVLSSSECERMIKIAEELSFCLFDKGKNIQGALTWVLDDASIDVLFERCRPAMPSRVRGTSGGGGPAADGDAGVSGGGGGEGAILTRAKAEPVVVADEGDGDAWALVGLNQRCRFYRYQVRHGSATIFVVLAVHILPLAMFHPPLAALHRSPLGYCAQAQEIQPRHLGAANGHPHPHPRPRTMSTTRSSRTATTRRPARASRTPTGEICDGITLEANEIRC